MRQYAGESLLPWEEHYLEVHAARYLDTLYILGPGPGRTAFGCGGLSGAYYLLAHHFGY